MKEMITYQKSSQFWACITSARRWDCQDDCKLSGLCSPVTYPRALRASLWTAHYLESARMYLTNPLKAIIFCPDRKASKSIYSVARAVGISIPSSTSAPWALKSVQWDTQLEYEIFFSLVAVALRLFDAPAIKMTSLSKTVRCLLLSA